MLGMKVQTELISDISVLLSRKIDSFSKGYIGLKGGMMIYNYIKLYTFSI